ncbi:MAG TPA: ATP-binding protein [Verrucomicrobiae bacterium]|jgi:signal transduction histidine kinase|nr:ATP-binding protein [Verrucomicrobiae bacterium]
MRATKETMPRRRRNLFRAYLIAIGLAVLPLTAFIIVAHRVLLHETTKRLITQSSRSGKAFAALVERPLTDSTAYLQGFAERSDVAPQWRRGNNDALATMLARTHKLRPGFTALGLYDRSGKLRAVSPANAALLGPDYHFADLSSALSAGRADYVSPAYHAAAGIGYAVAIAVPVNDENGNPLGLMVGEQTLATITHDVYEYATPENSALFFVVDQQGKIFGAQGPAIVAVPGNHSIVERLRKAEPKDTGERLSLGSQEVVASYTPIPSAGWGILISVPTTVIEQSLWKSERTLGLLLLIMLFLAVGGGGAVAAAFQRNRNREERYQDQLRMSENTLRLQNAQLAMANRELESFSYSVSHDLRAPLRAIDGFSGAILEDCPGQLDPVGLAHLQRVRAATTRMDHLIDGMLALARTARSAIVPEKVSLSRLAEEIVDRLQRAEPDRQVTVEIEPNLIVEGDRVLLQVMLENLLGNAWKFTSRRAGARIEFGSKAGNAPPVYFVRDNGAGFDMKYADRLFGAFQRLHDAREYPGTGIGLATVQRIIHRHGGQIWTESDLGRGATFYFSFAAADVPPASAAPEQKPVHAISAARDKS